jgi:Flp pilus assembly protein TadD
MRKMMLFVCGMLIFAIATPFVFAETIILKSGRSFEGKIIEKTDSYIKIDSHGEAFTYNMDEVERIEEEKPSTSDDVTSETSAEPGDFEKSAEQAFLDGKYEDAVLIMKKMIRLAPRDPALYTGLGIGSYYAGHFEESVSAFQEALNLSASVSGLYIYLGIVYDSMGDYEKAREALNKCVEESKKNLELGEVLIAETLLKKIGNK